MKQLSLGERVQAVAGAGVIFFISALSLFDALNWMGCRTQPDLKDPLCPSSVSVLSLLKDPVLLVTLVIVITLIVRAVSASHPLARRTLAWLVILWVAMPLILSVIRFS
jgi:hypothetical protein